jgi:hypothetical protein
MSERRSQAGLRIAARTAEAAQLELRLDQPGACEQRRAVDAPRGLERRDERRAEGVRHRSGAGVDPDDLGAWHALGDGRTNRRHRIIDAETVGADVLDDARRAGQGQVGVPDQKTQLLPAVRRDDQRLRQHPADERLEAAKPELALGRQHDAPVHFHGLHLRTHASQPRSELCRREPHVLPRPAHGDGL